MLAKARRLASLHVAVDLLGAKLSDAEQLVHALERQTLGLRDEEVHEGAHDDGESTEHEEHALKSKGQKN